MHLRKILAALLALSLILASLPALAAYNKPYYIEVDLTNQITTIYNTADGSIARQMLCSTGATGHETITGTYYLPAKDRDDERAQWYTFYALGVYAKWATRISGPYLFHSIPCYSKSLEDVVPRYVREFGMPASHGCVRLRVEDSEFIAKKCLAGTRVKIFYGDKLNEELRQLLYVSSYSADSGMTYREFLGISEDALGSGSSGTKVQDLQYRLSDLGYFDGQPDGIYGTQTIAAVKNFQAQLGVGETGITYDSLYAFIFSENAPEADGGVTLREGKSGENVRKLQQALSDMHLYTGEIDSIMDLEVTQAIQKFQTACGYTPDGLATPQLQHAVYYQLEEMNNIFGEGNIPAVEVVTEEIWQGTLNAKANIVIRAQMSTESSALGKVYIGEDVIVLGLENEWAHIYADSVAGYIYKKYLANPVSRENHILRYTGANGESYTLGRTVEQFLQGAQSQAAVMADAFAGEQFTQENADQTISYITVQTGSDAVRLNLRAEPSSEAAILAEVPNGTKLRVLFRDEQFACVGYGHEVGYLLNDYLSFWEGDENALQEQYVSLNSLAEAGVTLDDMGGKTTAIVVKPKEGKPYLYKKAALSGEKYCAMNPGVEVEVNEYVKDIDGQDDHWLQVSYLGQTGFMRASCLQFEYEGA